MTEDKEGPEGPRHEQNAGPTKGSPAPEMISIVLADDHHLVRQGLRALLSTERTFQVVGEAADGRAALDAVEKHRPDVLILDVSMPGLDGLEVARQVTQRHPQVRVVIVSMHAGEDYVLKAMRSGAQGYVLKDASADTLVEAVHSVAGGKRYLCSPLSERAIEAYIKQGDSGPQDVYDTLTTREREIFQLIAEGNTNNEIADRLSISVRTVETHRANLMRKLNLRTHAHLVAYAVRRGLITAGGGSPPPAALV